MKSMKVQKSLSHPGKEEKKKQSGDSVRSLALVAVCTCAAVAFAAGSRVADYNGKNKVYAASENEQETFSSHSAGNDIVPTGIAGVVSGMKGTTFHKKSVTRIGTSCEHRTDFLLPSPPLRKGFLL